MLFWSTPVAFLELILHIAVYGQGNVMALSVVYLWVEDASTPYLAADYTYTYRTPRILTVLLFGIADGI